MLGNGLLLRLLLILSAIGGANATRKNYSDPIVLTAMEQQREDFYLIRKQNQIRLEQQLALLNTTPQVRAHRQAEYAKLFVRLKQRTIRRKK